MSWWSDLVLAATAAAGNEVNVTQSAGPANATLPSNPIAGLTEVIAGIWTDVRDYKMWRSLGWIVLGIVLMLLSVAWYIGASAARTSPVGIVARELG